jgi:hypothetical protein
VAFVVIGGVAVLRWPRLVWVHVPAVIWAVLIEYAGWICPLTPLENALRQGGGEAAYAGGFVEHYVVPVLYPTDLTRTLQLLLGSVVLSLNALVYWQVARQRRRPRICQSPTRLSEVARDDLEPARIGRGHVQDASSSARRVRP